MCHYIAPILEEYEIIASSPCRIDPAGGTWDLKLFSLPYYLFSPSTVTFSIDLRLYVYLRPFMKGWIRVVEGNKKEKFRFSEMDFTSQFGLIYPLIAYFGFNGLEIEIKSTFPKYSGLGGSGVLTVTTISALNEVLQSETYESLKLNEIIHLAHEIEDGMHYSYTGLQDQCAAAYGGIHQWLWNYRDPIENFTIKNLLEPIDFPELESRIVLAYLGEGHNSHKANIAQVNSFLQGKLRNKWMRIKDITDDFAQAISEKAWDSAIALMQEENDIRCLIAENRITKLGKRLETVTKNLDSGFAIAGAGNGGCVWSLCSNKIIALKLRKMWKKILDNVPRARILSSKIANEGTKVLRRKKK
jgi:D-glycero-alpha-D-manno-heptose-7-phosphate kinase